MAQRSSSLGNRIQDVRGLAEISARELDRYAHITEGHTSLIESGHVENVSVKTLAKIAATLGVSLDWLVHGEGDPPSEKRLRAAVDAARTAYGKRKPAA